MLSRINFSSVGTCTREICAAFSPIEFHRKSVEHDRLFRNVHGCTSAPARLPLLYPLPHFTPGCSFLFLDSYEILSFFLSLRAERLLTFGSKSVSGPITFRMTRSTWQLTRKLKDIEKKRSLSKFLFFQQKRNDVLYFRIFHFSSIYFNFSLRERLSCYIVVASVSVITSMTEELCTTKEGNLRGWNRWKNVS